jgi:septum site-determining protein MinD
MVRVIDVCSGKGGVGKTVVASNLGMALQRLGKKTVVIDFNFTTSHLSLCLKAYSHPITINSVLRGEASLADAVFTHQSGLKMVLGSLKIEDMANIDASNMGGMIREAFSDYDFVLLDSAPGLGKEAMTALRASDEILYVANPSIPSIIDIAKCNKVADSLDNRPRPIGVVVNRVRNKSYEVKNDEIVQSTGLPIIGAIPEDERMLECTNKETLITIHRKNSPSSRAFFRIAARISGGEYIKDGMLSSLIKIFRRKKL